MGSGSKGPYGGNGSSEGSQPYAPTYHVVGEMMDRDKADSEIYNPSTGYPNNPTAKNIADSIVHEHIEIGGKTPNGPVTYVMDESGNIIIGKRSNPINPAKRSPHPMLIGGRDPIVQCAGMIYFKNGKILSIDNLKVEKYILKRSGRSNADFIEIQGIAGGNFGIPSAAVKFGRNLNILYGIEPLQLKIKRGIVNP